MERVAFTRARRYLNYNRTAKWTALGAAILIGLCYLGLLVVLGMFADLLVHRGQIPIYRDLLPTERAAFNRQWQGLADKEPLLTELTVDPARARALAESEPAILPPADQEQIWRSYLFQLVRERVSPEAAELILNDWHKADEIGQAPTNRGILSLVIWTRDRSYGPLLGWLAHTNPWMWRYADPGQVNTAYLNGLLALAIGFALLLTFAYSLMHRGAAIAASEASRRLRRAVYHHTYRQGTLAVRALGPSEASSIFTRHMEAIHDALYAWLTVIFYEPVKFFLLLGFALVVHVWLALAFTAFALLLWTVGGQFAAFVRSRGRSAIQRAANSLALLQESLAMMRLVKVYQMELFNQARVERQLGEYVRSHLARYRDETRYRVALIFLATVAALVLLYVSGVVVLSGGLGMPSLLMLVTALVSLYWPLVVWLEHRRVLRRGREAAAIVFRFLDRPGEVTQMAGAQTPPRLSRSLSFNGVSLSEPGTGRLLLHNIDLQVGARQKIGIVGTDDLEKHALLYLLPRFLDPTAGDIKIDDQDLRWVTLESLRRQIAVVMQHNLVFNDTIANNISCGDPQYNLPQIIEAAKVAHAHQFILKLPQGYQTPVGDQGHALRIGEQFRLALARAVLRDPALLIIEEPTATLDDDTKAALDDTFTRILPGRTVIFLPHRLSTIRACDRVFLLHKGHIEASGEHRDLLAQNDLYRHLQYLEFNVFADQV